MMSLLLKAFKYIESSSLDEQSTRFNFKLIKMKKKSDSENDFSGFFPKITDRERNTSTVVKERIGNCYMRSMFKTLRMSNKNPSVSPW